MISLVIYAMVMELVHVLLVKLEHLQHALSEKIAYQALDLVAHHAKLDMR
jgi:hypothetical protein